MIGHTISNVFWEKEVEKPMQGKRKGTVREAMVQNDNKLGQSKRR